MLNYNNYNSKWKKILGFRNMQEKLEKVNFYSSFLQERAIKQFGSADAEYGRMLRERISFYKKGKNGVKETIATPAIAHI